MGSSSLQGYGVFSRVRELMTLVNNAHVVCGIGFCRGRGIFASLSPSEKAPCQKYTFGTPQVLGETMTAIHETAYPRLRSNLSEKELKELYTPTPDDLAFLERATKSTVAAFGGLVL